MSDVVMPVGEGNGKEVFTGNIVKMDIAGSSEKRRSLWNAQFHSVENLKRLRAMGGCRSGQNKKEWNLIGGRIL